jgi:hypothetical protein
VFDTLSRRLSVQARPKRGERLKRGIISSISWKKFQV